MNLNVELFPLDVSHRFSSRLSLDFVIRPVAVGREAVGLRSLGVASCARDGAPGSGRRVVGGWTPLPKRN